MRFQMPFVERYRRMRRRLAVWRRHDPGVWVIVVTGMALGLCLFVLQLALVGLFRVVAHVTRWVR